jgi:hypothetical protein
MEKLAIISIAFLIIVPQFNSPTPSLDTSKAETLVSGYFITQDQQFPDRSKEAGIAKQIDAQREQARLAAIQAAEAAKQAQVVQTPTQAQTTPTIAPQSPDSFITALGQCESGNTANRNSGNGYYGAFQFSIATWNAMNTGYARADLAPYEVQVAAVRKLLSTSSVRTQFPACAKKLGL